MAKFGEESGDVQQQQQEQQGRKPKRSRSSGHGGGFESMDLAPEVYRAVRRKGFRLPTPIQRKAIPHLLRGYDLVAMARTGSGKTAAFAVPLIHRLFSGGGPGGDGGGGGEGSGWPRGVVLSPTRELAAQTAKVVKDMSCFTKLRHCLLVGGENMEAQFEGLASSPDILIATPGRLAHHLAEIKTFTLFAVEMLILDEADRLFEMGFAAQLREIISAMKPNKQTALFSATLPAMLAEFARAGLRNPKVVRLDTDTMLSPDLKLAFLSVRSSEKTAALIHLLRTVASSPAQTLVFAPTRHHVEFLGDLLAEEGIPNARVFGKMDQDARKANISRFRSNKVSVMLVTDVAARGIDIPLLDNVIHYDVPAAPKLFVHRSGRVARAGRSGSAFILVSTHELAYVLDIHLFLGRKMKAAGSPDGDTDSDASDKLSILGKIPQDTIDFVQESVHTVVRDSVSLSASQKVTERAMKLYTRTRTAPSKESVTRAKERKFILHAQNIQDCAIHPIFLNNSNTSSSTRIKSDELLEQKNMLSAQIRKYKPKRAAMDLTESVGEAAKRNADVIHKFKSLADKRRKIKDEEAAEKGRGPEEEESIPIQGQSINNVPLLNTSSQDFRDQNFFLSSRPRNSHAERHLSMSSGESRLEDNVFDLNADDEEGIKKKRATYHWDRRKKKYIKLNAGDEAINKGSRMVIRNESGVKSMVDSKNAGEKYQKWAMASKRSITGKAAVESSEAGQNRTDWRRKKGKGKAKTSAGGKTPSRAKIAKPSSRPELKNLDQLKKDRKTKTQKTDSFNQDKKRTRKRR